ncbi:MAG: hypothetical protein RIR70_603 [Pseudomonadota bacterium]
MLNASTHQPVLITGATQQIGAFLIRHANAHGIPLILVSRTPPASGQAGARWHVADISQGDKLPAAEALIHLAPLRLLPALLPAFIDQGGRRVIALSTASRHSKAASPNAAERAFAARVFAVEQQVAQLCESRGVAWTLFRPTLIYGANHDRNIALITRVVRLLGFFPLLGAARGLRQPVHAEDLAAACMIAIDNPATFNKAYDLPGGETLPYREMVARIFASQGQRPRFIHLPICFFAAALRLLSCLPRYRDFNPEMAKRMNQDLVFDSQAAREDFAWAPRGFLPPGPKDAA